MDLEAYVQALQDDLARVAAVGDESTARAGQLLAVALESAVGRRLQDALAEAALELSAQLEHGRVEVRLAGDELALVLVDEPTAAPPDAPGDESFDARITLRLPEGLKARLDAAAAAAGVSVNTWLVQLLARSLAPRPAGGGNRQRLTGFGRS